MVDIWWIQECFSGDIGDVVVGMDKVRRKEFREVLAAGIVPGNKS
jgi:hypothetical protein